MVKVIGCHIHVNVRSWSHCLVFPIYQPYGHGRPYYCAKFNNLALYEIVSAWLGLIIFFADDIKWYIEQKEHYKHWEHVCNVIIKLILLETKSPTSIFGKIIPRALMATKHSWSNHTLPIYILYIHCLHLRNHSFIFHVVF